MSDEWRKFSRRDDVQTSSEMAVGEYRAPRDEKGTPRVSWKCPGCEKTLCIVNSNHDIRFDGYVHPAVRCPLCSHEEWMCLENWVPKARGNA